MKKYYKPLIPVVVGFVAITTLWSGIGLIRYNSSKKTLDSSATDIITRTKNYRDIHSCIKNGEYDKADNLVKELLEWDKKNLKDMKNFRGLVELSNTTKGYVEEEIDNIDNVLLE